jgi:glycosyltransferase involved in cell wall biosynthesis
MKILFVSNYYPPRTNGGYEQWCQEVADGLAERGHEVRVLTSHGGPGWLEGADLADDGAVQIHRLLHLEVEGGLVHTGLRVIARREQLEQANLRYVWQVVDDWRPDVALIWGMWNVPRSVPVLLEELLGPRLAYYFCDYWPTLPSAYLQQMREPARRGITRVPKWLISRAFVARLAREAVDGLRFEHPICVSEAVRRKLVLAGVPVSHAQIIYGGTLVDAVSPRPDPLPRDGELRLLYAGRLTPTKGVHTAIQALRILAHEAEARVTLDILGGGDPDYERCLKRLADQVGVADRVRFRGGVPRSEMPRVFREHDVLLLLSEWEEPFARVVLEAMAARLLVIGSLTGGTPEILVDGETGLSFPPGDANRLAQQIRRLLGSPALYGRMAEAGRHKVAQRFTLDLMLDQLEHALLDVSSVGQLAHA